MNKFCWILTVLLCGLPPATSDNVLETCLFRVFKDYFLNEPVLLVTDFTVDRQQFARKLLPEPDREYERDFIKKIMRKRNWMLQIYNTDRYMGLPAKLKFDKLKNCFFFIREKIIASKELFEAEMERLQENPLWDPTGRNVIVVNARGVVRKSEVLAKNIIEKLWAKSKAVDNLLMIAEKNGTVQFYTWFPYRQPDCSLVKQIVHLNTFRRGRFLRSDRLFPVKILEDLQGCEIIAATDTCIPYVFAHADNASVFIDGLEIKIVQSLSEQLNFKVRTVRPENMWTSVVNNSVVGAFRLLMDQKIDLAFSCLMLNQERYLLALALPSYYEDALSWFVPSPVGRTHATDIFYSFSVEFWLLMMCVLVASVAVVILLTRTERDSKDWMGHVVQIIGMSLYVSAEIPTKKVHTRVFLFLFFMYSLHITIAFQSSLFALYRKPHYERHYSSLEDAVNAGLLVYLRSSSQELYNQTDHGLWNKILRPGSYDYLTDFGEAFSEIAYDKSAVALFIKTTGIYMVSLYFTDEFGTPQILCLKNKFSRYPVTMYMSPGHPLYRAFHNRIHSLLSSGLIRFWLENSVLGGKLRWVADSYTNNPLSMNHLGGVFFLLLLLLAASVFTFGGEIIAFYLLRKNDPPLLRKKHDRQHFLPLHNRKMINSKASVLVRVGNTDHIF